MWRVVRIQLSAIARQPDTRKIGVGENQKVTDLAAKKQILKNNGYSYSFDRELYVNRSLKKAFSVEFIEDHSETEIEHLARSKSEGQKWHFFFNTKPSEATERKLANMLD